MNVNWERTTVGEISINLDSKRRPVKEKDRIAGHYPYYGASGVVDHVNDYIFDGDYVLVAEDGENLRTRKTPVAFPAKGKFWVNNHAHILKGNEKSLTSFLCYLIQATDISAYLTGSTIPKLNQKNLNDIQVSIPSITTQKAIAHILGTLDDKIELNRQTNQTLEAIAQAIFKSWFVDFEPTRAKLKAKQNGQDPERAAMAAISGKTVEQLDQLSPEQQQQLKTTATLFPDALKDSELGEIPEGWGVESVGNNLSVTKGRSYKSAELEESNTALVTLKSFLRGGGYREDGLKEYTGTYKPEQVIEPGELVMSLTDVTQAAEIVGKPAIVTRNYDYETLVASLDVAILRPNGYIMKEFFYGLMCTYRFHRYVESFATGTTVLHLNTKGISSFEFPLPDSRLCKAYACVVGPMLSKHEGNIHLSRSLSKLRDVLLPRLLSGELTEEQRSYA